MLDPLDFENRPLAEKLERKRRLAALALLAERLTLAFWRVAAWFMLFAGLWMFRLPPIFGDTAAILTAVAFYAGAIYFLITDLRHFRWPDAAEIDRRIESESRIRHRPLSGMKDSLSNPLKTETRNLWAASRQQVIKALPFIKAGPPQPLLASRDPRALRLGIAMFFILGLVVSGPHWDERLRDGLTPFSLQGGLGPDHDITMWITPPGYTRAEQIILSGSGKSEDELKIPSGSILKIRVRSSIGTPELQIDERTWPLQYTDEDNYALEMTILDGENIRIKQMFLTRADWRYQIIPDNAPVISSKGDAETLPGGALRFPLTVYDDYGVKTLTMSMKLSPTAGDAPLGKDVSETRSVMSPSKTEFELQPVYDLTSHPFAGLPVIFTFTAEDHVAQTAALTPIQIVLPERAFTHPVAKALIDIRKRLAWDPVDDYEPIARELESLLVTPYAYQDDIVAFLAIRSAASRLLHFEPAPEITESLLPLLWDTALRIEDGNLTLAARRLRDAQHALENALKNPDITNKEVGELMNDLRQAMAEYFSELQREIQKRMAEGQNMPMVPPEMLSQMIDPEALSEFLDQMEAQMRSGDRNAAQEMLSQLQRMMDMMDPSMTAPLPPDMKMMSEGVNQLQELIKRQEELLAQTHKQVEALDVMRRIRPDYGRELMPNTELMQEWNLGDMPPAPEAPDDSVRPQVDTQKNSTEQEALRYILGQLMLEASEVLPEIPENMGMAEREMHSSANALSGNMPDQSVPHQERAIEYLQQAQQQLTQQLMARMQQMTGMSFSAGGMRYDPLGRPLGGEQDQNGMLPGSRVKVPDESERKKAQEILKLLRQRSGEAGRPDDELEYFRRLLRQF